MLFHLCGLDAGGEQFDEFGAVVAKGGECLVGLDELGVAQELKPVLRLCGLLESDLELGGEVGLALCIAALGNVRADGSTGPQHLLCDDRFLAITQIFVQANDAQGESFCLCEHDGFGHLSSRSFPCRRRL